MIINALGIHIAHASNSVQKRTDTVVLYVHGLLGGSHIAKLYEDNASNPFTYHPLDLSNPLNHRNSVQQIQETFRTIAQKNRVIIHGVGLGASYVLAAVASIEPSYVQQLAAVIVEHPVDLERIVKNVTPTLIYKTTSLLEINTDNVVRKHLGLLPSQAVQKINVNLPIVFIKRERQSCLLDLSTSTDKPFEERKGTASLITLKEYKSILEDLLQTFLTYITDKDIQDLVKHFVLKPDLITRPVQECLLQHQTNTAQDVDTPSYTIKSDRSLMHNLVCALPSLSTTMSLFGLGIVLIAAYKLALYLDNSEVEIDERILVKLPEEAINDAAINEVIDKIINN